ncbi:hypothetical protein GN956_G6779 [Arapaima gigas]
MEHHENASPDTNCIMKISFPLRSTVLDPAVKPITRSEGTKSNVSALSGIPSPIPASAGSSLVLLGVPSNAVLQHLCVPLGVWTVPRSFRAQRPKLTCSNRSPSPHGNPQSTSVLRDQLNTP